MNKIFLFVCLLLALAQPASAEKIPSEASAVYLGSDRVCFVEFSSFQVLWIRLDLTCLKFTGALSNSRTILYAPDQCWDSSVSTTFDAQVWNEFFAFRSYASNSSAVQILRGPDQTQVANGIGIHETWNRVAVVQSSAPYTCNAPTTIKPRG